MFVLFSPDWIIVLSACISLLFLVILLFFGFSFQSNFHFCGVWIGLNWMKSSFAMESFSLYYSKILSRLSFTTNAFIFFIKLFLGVIFELYYF